MEFYLNTVYLGNGCYGIRTAAEKYFGKEAKKDITEIVYEIIDTYKKRIKTNDILGEDYYHQALDYVF